MPSAGRTLLFIFVCSNCKYVGQFCLSFVVSAFFVVHIFVQNFLTMYVYTSVRNVMCACIVDIIKLYNVHKCQWIILKTWFSLHQLDVCTVVDVLFFQVVMGPFSLSWLRSRTPVYSAHLMDCMFLWTSQSRKQSFGERKNCEAG